MNLLGSPSRKKATCIMKAHARLVSLWTEGPAMGQGSTYTNTGGTLEQEIQGMLLSSLDSAAWTSNEPGASPKARIWRK
ncbi:hypothetical protein EK904_010340 [Melospiza melodia maxima]|nr:hypothetical protein EK904_010340 [Melospiza melodia maxima]